ncbi:response regulator transcription factor [Paenibacillus pinistramenti]|uniref:response regulator transcription factor n=1 Tax=Paenibacillus pinistramenti TaxID=1768003 RepID=UPI0011082AF5|nr:response regulator [Paenibacillus pinistramenti]
MLRTILIVDDEPGTRNGIRKTLELWADGRYRVECAANGVEAAEWLERDTAHLLITDVRMPEVSGLDLIRLLEGRPDRPASVVISGYAEFEYVQTALRLGAVGYLLKPIDKEELLEMTERALKQEEERHRAEKLARLVDPKLFAIKEEEFRPGGPVGEVMEYVDGHLQEQLTMADMAAKVHLNASYFSVLFKEEAGIPFSEYVTRRRIQHAKQLLAQTRLPVGQIAEQVGYSTDKYFIKVFKQLEQISPSRYRSEMAEYY